MVYPPLRKSLSCCTYFVICQVSCKDRRELTGSRLLLAPFSDLLVADPPPLKEDFEKEELTSFLNANTKISEIQMGAQDTMVKIVEEQGELIIPKRPFIAPLCWSEAPKNNQYILFDRHLPKRRPPRPIMRYVVFSTPEVVIGFARFQK